MSFLFVNEKHLKFREDICLYVSVFVSNVYIRVLSCHRLKMLFSIYIYDAHWVVFSKR